MEANFAAVVEAAARSGATRQAVTESLANHVAELQEGFQWWEGPSRAAYDAGVRWGAVAAFFPEGETEEEASEESCFPESWFPSEDSESEEAGDET